MTTITYTSPQLYMDASSRKHSSTKDGLKCDWTGTVEYNYGLVNMSWNFNWDELKNNGVDGLTGHITVKSPDGEFQLVKVDVDLKNTPKPSTSFTIPGYSGLNITFEYSLNLYTDPVEEVSYDEMFAPSENNDAILVVEGKKCHVSKAFLSYHSDYFRALFSSSFKEGQMMEIPIKDVSYEDFGLLLSSFYPDPVFPNDKTVEKLLEMADRFSMPSVIKIVQYHLVHNSRISSEKMMWMADRYIMPKVLQKTIREMNTTAKAKALKSSSEYKKLSDSAKGQILDRVMELI